MAKRNVLYLYFVMFSHPFCPNKPLSREPNKISSLTSVLVQAVIDIFYAYAGLRSSVFIVKNAHDFAFGIYPIQRQKKGRSFAKIRRRVMELCAKRTEFFISVYIIFGSFKKIKTNSTIARYKRFSAQEVFIFIFFFQFGSHQSV